MGNLPPPEAFMRGNARPGAASDLTTITGEKQMFPAEAMPIFTTRGRERPRLLAIEVRIVEISR